MFLRPNKSLRLSVYSLTSLGFSKCRDFHLTHCAYLRRISSNRRKVTEERDYEKSSAVAGEFSVSSEPKKLNNNFFGIESDEGVIVINSKPSLTNYSSKQLLRNVEKEKFITTTFGSVRYDSDNKPIHHGQLEKEKVMISSNVEKNKIKDLSQTLLSKNSPETCNIMPTLVECNNSTTKINGKLESKLPSSSYVDELYFPESYTEVENNNSDSKSSLDPPNNHTVNFIEESYFNDNMINESVFRNANNASKSNDTLDESHSFNIREKSKKIENYKVSSFQAPSRSESLSSSEMADKSDFIEDHYFPETVTSKSATNTCENTSFQEKTECIADEQQLRNVDSYFTTIYDDNLKNINKKSQVSISKIVDTERKKPNKENSTILPEVEKEEEPEKDLFLNNGMRDFQVTSKEVTSNAGLKPSYNPSKNIEEMSEDEQSLLQWNNPNIEELEDYNKFLPDATPLQKKKNNFLFQNQKLFKGREQINSKTSRLKILSIGEPDGTEKSQNKENISINPQESQNIKVKELNVKSLNSNEQPETAYDFVKKLRSTKKMIGPELVNGKFIQKNEQYDSKGFRILKNQVPDWKHYTRDEILDVLVKNVLYSDDDVIVLNKPYNFVMHESKTTKDPCISQYLDDLAAQLDEKTHNPKLITVHRLDKETSGCLLLARNEVSAQRLLSLFAQRKITKTYWIVTIKVPDPLEGIIDMAISEGFVNGRARMVLHPNLPKDIPYYNHSKSGKRAVTHYQVISESGNAALVEAKPETGIKHQIRVHFGFGLSCPILGDHKYSHLDKLAPQKLQTDLLQKLHVQQSKVRHIPMHIYARSILIPQYSDGRNLFVMAPMPIHMSQNLQKLKFRKK